MITGESLIHKDDFERLKISVELESGKEIRNARNLASGSVRVLNPAVCKDRCVYFYAFNILEGMEAFGEIADSRSQLLLRLQSFGFSICPFVMLEKDNALSSLKWQIDHLKNIADDRQIPIDGMVLRYDSLAYSKSCGRTGHHYKDGIAFKFEDDTYETTFRSIEWAPSRSGEIAPIALFDTVEIDGCSVSRAIVHL